MQSVSDARKTCSYKQKAFGLTGKIFCDDNRFSTSKNGFCWRHKILSSTRSVLLGRKPCSYQRKTFCLTGKNVLWQKPFFYVEKRFLSTTKNSFFDVIRFTWMRTVFLPTENILPNWKKLLWQNRFIRRKKLFVDDIKFFLRREVFYLDDKRVLTNGKYFVLLKKMFCDDNRFSTWKNGFCRRQKFLYLTSSVLLGIKPCS